MIEIKNISKTYPSGETSFKAVNNVSLTIESGDFVAIMGASGSGKSTLMHIIGFLDRPDEGGSFKIFNDDIFNRTDDELALVRNQLIGFVFQQFHLLPRITALQNTELPLIYAGRHDMVSIAQDKLGQVGLGNRTAHHPNQLSGGEQQRVAISRALVNDPPIILADEPTGNLDTASEKEIIAILKELHASGKTIIMVTHEMEVAEIAHRIIRMRDGQIISDERKAPLNDKGQVAHASAQKILHDTSHAGNSIELKDYVRQAFQAIFSNKMRSFLSMLGITIGVAAVIAMSALGSGAQRSITQQLSSLGTNILTLMPGSTRVGGVSLGAGAVTRFTIQDADAIAKLPEVKAVNPSVRGTGQAIYLNNNWSTQLQGAGLDYAAMNSAQPTVGRFFTAVEIRQRKKVAVIGLTVVEQLYGKNNPIGTQIKINRNNFTVIGVLPEKGSNGFQDQDDMVIIPITTAMYRVMGKDYLNSISIEGKDTVSLTPAQTAVTNLIMKRHRLKDDSSFQIRNMSEIRNMLESTTKTMSLLLGAIAAISLLVGGIGIMNIMLVSVTERTREIGLRKAIGARNKDILTQFLIEAITMTFSGGLLGIVLGAGAAQLITLFAKWSVYVELSAVLTAVLFSVLVGLIFGISPARKAAHLNPIEALRYE